MSEQVPEAAPVDAPVVDTPAAEPAFQVDPAEWQQTQERLQEIAQIVQPPPQPWQQQQPQGPPLPDPWNRPDTYEQDFQTYIDHQLQPLHQLQNEMTNAEGHEKAMGMLDQITARDSLGEIDKEMAWTVARQMVATGQARAPQNDHEAEQILVTAAKQVDASMRAYAERYHQQQIEQVQTISGAPRVFQPGAAGAQTLGVGGYGNVPNAVTTRMFGRRP